MTARLDEVLNARADSGAVLAARVLEMPGGRELYVANSDLPVMPASNMKLITSAAGLVRLGTDRAFTTRLVFDGKDLHLIGSGDPGIGDGRIARSHGEGVTSVFESWATQMKTAGITRVPGSLIYYDGAFEAQRIHPSWAHDDLVHWYAAPVSGLNFNDNCIDVTVFPAADGEPCGYEVVPPCQDITLVNECVSGDPRKPTVDRLAFASVYVLGGGCTKRKALKSKPVTDPGAFFADALRTHFAAAGIEIEGGIQAGIEPPALRSQPLVAEHQTAMGDVLWRIDKTSQNLFAECLLKLTGQAFDVANGLSRPGSWASGARAVKAFFDEQGISREGLVVADGSGLSRGNRVTARIITDLLLAMNRHEQAGVYRANLAEPGGIGTLRSRMKDLKGHVFAKTGYIRGVRALSGYVHANDGRWYCFSFIYNDIPGSVKPFERMQDQACRILVEGWKD